MSYPIVTVKPSDRDKVAASSAMIAIQGSIPYSKVLECVQEAIAIAREEGYRAGWNDATTAMDDKIQSLSKLLRQKDEAMEVLFVRLGAAGVDCSDLFP